MSLPILKPDDCRFMRSEHVERYNRIAAFLEKCREPLSDQGQEESVQVLEARMQALADKMSLDRFRIGFIGPSQVGKSFTVANFLGVSRDESPTPEGKGEAMTSAPTRVRRAAPGTTGPGRVQLHYMLRDEFRTRVNNICTHPDLAYLEITPHHDPARILEAVRSVRDRVRPGDLKTYQYLIRVLQSGIRYGTWLAETEAGRKSVAGSYENRRLYVADEYPDAPENQHLLLKEVVIDLASDVLPEDLEIIDLPGMGTLRKSDDEVTRAFLPQLRGAFIFQKCHQLDEGAVGTLLNALHVEYKEKLQGRIWYVVTFLDNLNPAQVKAGQDTILDLIGKRIELYGLRADRNVLLVGNEYYQEIVRKGPDGRKRSPGETEHGWRQGPGGVPEPIESMSRPEALSKLYTEVLKTGGIPLLREVATTQVRNSVQAAEQADVQRELDALRQELEKHLDRAAARSAMNRDAIIACVKWKAQLQVFRTRRLTTEFRHVEGPVRDLQAAIEATADDMLPDGYTVDPTEMEAEHRRVIGVLIDTGVEKAGTAVTSAFSGVMAMVREIQAGQIQDGPIQDPSEECIRELKVRSEENAWITDVFNRFGDDFPGVSSLSRMDVYRAVLHRKIAALVRELASRIIYEAGEVLSGVERRLKDLGGNASRGNDPHDGTGGHLGMGNMAQRELLQQLARDSRGL